MEILGMTLKLGTVNIGPTYNIRHHFIGSNLIYFQFLCTNILNYFFFTLAVQRLLKITKVWKIKKKRL